jgi:hypothetical protein
MYFKIDCQAGTEETGRSYPQLHCITQKEAFSLKTFKKKDKIPSLEFELVKRSKISDVLSQGSISSPGIMLSERAMSLVNQFRLQDHIKVPVKVHNELTVSKYTWLQFVSDRMLKLIDFEKCIFYQKEFGFRKGDNFRLPSYNELKKKEKEFGKMSYITAELIGFNTYFQHDLDLFSIPDIDYGVYGSLKLINSLKEEKITGIEIIEATNIIA